LVPPIVPHSCPVSSLFLHFFCFFLLIRLPPISTLFPTRRSSDLNFAKFCFDEFDEVYYWSTFNEIYPVATNQYLTGAFPPEILIDRKSTRLNSSHVSISYAVLCLKKIECQSDTMHELRE